MLAFPLVCQTVDEPRIRVEVEDDGLVICEDGREFAIGHAMWMLAMRDQLEQVDNVDEANLQVWEGSRSKAVAARDSMVGTSPQEAMTTSGSSPWSLDAQAQIPTPFVQCSIAASMSRY